MSFRKAISWCLFPLTAWYAVGVWMRNRLFDLGIARQSTTGVVTIGIGNLCAGGAGKTPHADYLMNLLSGTCPTAFLSRGYGRKTKGYLLDDGSHDARRIGDEPAMIAEKYGTVAVCEKRVAGVARLLSDKPDTKVVVLDDVFQHRQIKPTIDILLTEYSKPFFKDRVLPFGDLREQRSGYRRANIIIVTKSPEQLNSIDKNNFLQALNPAPYQRVFFSYLRYSDPRPLLGGAPRPIAKADAVLLLTGIAHPEPMRRYVEQHCGQLRSVCYPDHHDYTLADLKGLAKELGRLEGERRLILTTEKDAARLRSMPQAAELLAQLPIWVLPIEVRMHQTDDYGFDQTITGLVNENLLYLEKVKSSNLSF